MTSLAARIRNALTSLASLLDAAQDWWTDDEEDS